MNTYTVTISSKNQFTLPAKLVRDLKLGKGSRVEIRQKAGALELVPKPSLEDALGPLHSEIADSMNSRGVKAPTDKDLKNFIRKVSAKRSR